MRYSFLLALSVCAMATIANAAPTTRPGNADVIRLWEARAPRSTGNTPADVPEITAFFPDAGKANGCAVVICPGGGYVQLSTQQEGTDIAHWLNDHGVAAFVLKYRVSPYGQPCPLLDGQRAIRTVRFNAKAWGIDWKRIGIMGFDTGGHVAASVGTHFDPYIPGSPDPINGQSCRPDFMLLVYPLITMRDKVTNNASRQALLGDHPDQKLVDLYSLESQVKSDTPPTFITASKTDDVIPVRNSELFVNGLKSHDVAYEFLELPTGGHGYGLGTGDAKLSVWTERCLAWMDKQGYLKKPEIRNQKSEKMHP